MAQRTQEIAIRMALGASCENVMKMILLQGARIACLGLVIGLVAAVGLTRYLENCSSPSAPAIL